MSAIIWLDGKPHQECGCDQFTPTCSRVGQRALDSCGFRRCMVPADNVYATVTCDGIDWKARAEAAEAALREATNKALEEAAMECEARNVKRNGYVSRKREEARACAAAIRSLKTPPVDG